MLTPGNHDGQLAWDDDSVAVLRDRLGVTDVALACDLAVETGNGVQLVRVMHGHQFDPYNAFDDPRSPVDTPLGHHVVRQVLPKLASRDQPGSLLEGVRWCNGDPSAFLGSRLLYRMVAGWLWWLAVPFAAALVLRLLSFAPGLKPLLDHHAERWLVLFGILVVAIAVVAAVTGIATMLRVNRALADASISERGDAAAHNAAARAEAARLISAGYAGLITGHTHEPEISQVGDGFYANTGCATEVVRARKARFGLPAPFLARATAVHDRVAGVWPGAVGLVVFGRTARRSAFRPRAAGPGAGAGPAASARSRRPAPRRSHLADQRAGLDAVGAASPGPAGGCVRAAHRGTAERRLRVPVAGPLASPGGRPGCPSAFIPSAVVTAVIGGLALAGVARGVRHGYRRAWLAALVILLVSIVYRLVQGVGLGRDGHRLPVRPVAAVRAPPLPGQPGGPAPRSRLGHHGQPGGGGPGRRA